MAGDSKGNLASFDLQKKLDDLVAQIASEEPDLTKKLNAANGKAATAPAVPPQAVAPVEEETDSGPDAEGPSSEEIIHDAGEDALEAIEKASADAKTLEEELAAVLREDAESDSMPEDEDSEPDAGEPSGSLAPDSAANEQPGQPTDPEKDAGGSRGRVLAEDAIGSKLDELLNAANQPLADPVPQEQTPESQHLMEDGAGNLEASPSDGAVEAMGQAEIEARQALESALIGSEPAGDAAAADDSAGFAAEASVPAQSDESMVGETESAAVEQDDVADGTFTEASTMEETTLAKDAVEPSAAALVDSPEAPVSGSSPKAATAPKPAAKSPAVSAIQDSKPGEPGSKTKEAMLGALRASGLFGSSDAGTEESEPAKTEPEAAAPAAVASEVPAGDESSTIEDLDQALAQEADDEPEMAGDFQSVDDLLGEDEPQTAPEPKVAAAQVAAAPPARAPKPVRIDSERRSIPKAVMIWLAGVDWKRLQQRAVESVFKTCAWLNRPSEKLGTEGQKIIGYAAGITAANAALISLWRILL